MPNDNNDNVLGEAAFSLDEMFEEGLAIEQAKLEDIAQKKIALEEFIANLPDQRIAYISQQSKYAESAKHRAEMVKLGNLAAKQAEAKYKKENPEAKDLVFRTQSTATLIPEGKEIDIDSFYKKILDIIMWRSDDFVTQKAILEEVNKDFLHAPQNSNRWTTPLPKWQLTKMSAFIDGNRPQWRVSLTNCKNLRDCRKAMLFAKEALNPNKAFNLTVRVSSKQILINDVAYPISSVKSGKNEYPSIRVGKGSSRDWIRIQALSLLLEATKK